MFSLWYCKAPFSHCPRLWPCSIRLEPISRSPAHSLDWRDLVSNDLDHWTLTRIRSPTLPIGPYAPQGGTTWVWLYAQRMRSDDDVDAVYVKYASNPVSHTKKWSNNSINAKPAFQALVLIACLGPKHKRVVAKYDATVCRKLLRKFWYFIHNKFAF